LPGLWRSGWPAHKLLVRVEHAKFSKPPNLEPIIGVEGRSARKTRGRSGNADSFGDADNLRKAESWRDDPVTVRTTRSRRGGRLTAAGFSPQAAGKGGTRKTPGDGSGTAVITRSKTQTQRPSMYRVLLLNDDYTPMEFVVGVLCTFFHKNLEDANRIMWQVHTNGVGECGVFTYEVADTKVTQVMDHARKHQHPLQCVMEKK
jgi:ATP-dependent Clp protease adaptor protein ClpS